LKDPTFKYYPTFWQAANLIVIYIFIQTLIDFPLAVYDYNHGTDWLYQQWVKVPVFLGSTLLILYLGYLFSGLSFIQVFSFKLFNLLVIPAMVIIFSGLQYFLNEISIHFEKLLPPPTWFMELFSRLFDSNLGVWGGILRIVIIAPIVEELIFRGIIMSGFTRNYNAVFAIFFSALLFALFHLNPWQFPAAFALGLILGWIRIRTGSVLACIAGHAIHNGLVFLSVLYYNDLKDLSFMQPGDSKNYGIHFGLLAIGIVLVWFLTSKGIKNKIKDLKPEISVSKVRVVPSRKI
jgi:membrane protease YdiL (CAAX protease family)